MNKEPVAIVELGGEITWLTDVLPYKAKLYTHPVKELTDEEILKVSANKFLMSEHRLVLLFARELLRKAQEK